MPAVEIVPKSRWLLVINLATSVYLRTEQPGVGNVYYSLF